MKLGQKASQRLEVPFECNFKPLTDSQDRQNPFKLSNFRLVTQKIWKFLLVP